MNAIVFGCGYAGSAIARALSSAGMNVHGTVRTDDGMHRLASAGIAAIRYDGKSFSSQLLSVLSEATHLVSCIAPDEMGDPVISSFGARISRLMPRLKWIAYLSTVGVYGDHQGRWVDEMSLCTPTTKRSKSRLLAEKAWMGYADALGLPLSILRLSGIYGPGRNALATLQRGTARCLVKKDQVFNRVRVEDIGAAALFLAERQQGGLFNVSDDHPAPPQDVVTEAARLLCIEPPPYEDVDQAKLSEPARSFFQDNKRVSNAKLKSEGFQFQFPDYVVALSQLVDSGSA
ncbi:SDR family oxidoreductase [Ensifer adhaerens]|uniref:SDR family oxidoreductase n=1 Tax=Ensifer adhaerens TaxID=106592 RepID=A0A9Q9DE96_ENSAD|nr:SDR family oxidoreductase [Ensifer adhaerens]USJ28508.1 SDR family oxidoreductase [Ensifer adhaerens]